MTLHISPVKPEDIPAIQAISEAANESQVMPLLAEEGCATLRASQVGMRQRLLNTATYSALKATLDGQVVGYVTWRDGHFVIALYVHLAHQRQGVGRLLMDAMVSCASLPQVKLRASINAVDFYLNYGFQAEGPEQVLHGIRFVPMVLELGPN